MLEAILASELYSIVCLILPWIISIAGAIGTAAVAIFKVGQVINEFRGSNELKEYNSKMGEYLKENKKLTKEVNELKEAVKGIHRPGWTDDKED